MLNVIPCLLLVYLELFILLHLFPISGLNDFSGVACNTACLPMSQVIKTLQIELLLHFRSGGHCSKKQTPRYTRGAKKEWDAMTEPAKSSSQNEKRNIQTSLSPCIFACTCSSRSVKLKLESTEVLTHSFSRHGKSCSYITACLPAPDWWDWGKGETFLPWSLQHS